MIKFILLICVFSINLWAGQEIGNGGDSVHCVASDKNQFSGLYSLDYLLTYQETNANNDIVQVATLQESLLRITRLLKKKAPEFMEGFDDFVGLIQNKDVAQARFWEEAPFGLIDLKDEKMVNLVPANCRQGNAVQIVQTVIRQDPEASGVSPGKVLYKYVPSIFEKLEKQNPIQLSFLLVHEWLWDVSSNVDRNRRINRFLHSNEFELLTRDQTITKLKALGLQIPDVKIPSPEAKFCRCFVSTGSSPFYGDHEFSCKKALVNAFNKCTQNKKEQENCGDIDSYLESPICVWMLR